MAPIKLNSSSFTHTSLRKHQRRQRVNLTCRRRKQSAYQALRHLTQLSHIALPATNANIGLFVDAFGEMPTQPLLDWARKHRHNIYLPVVTRNQHPLVFIEFSQKHWLNARLPRHPLGMRQPETGNKLKASELDVLFMPLVAADKLAIAWVWVGATMIEHW